MHYGWRYIFLISLHLLSLTFIGVFTARGDDTDDALQMCQSLIRQRENQMNIPSVSAEAIGDLLHCNGELAELFNPTIVLEEGVTLSDFQCGTFQLGCQIYSGLAWDYFSYWAGARSYVKQIKDRMKEDELARLAVYTETFPELIEEGSGLTGLDAIVTRAYNQFEEDHPWELNGFNGIKTVLVDFSFHYIRSELIGFGFDPSNNSDLQVMETEARRYQVALEQCFSQTEVIQGVDSCISLMKAYGSFGMGHFVLEKNLETNFLHQIAESQKPQFLAEVDHNLNVCLPHFFFNPEEEATPFQKMRACIFYTFVEGFHWVLGATLAINLDLDTESSDLKQRVDQLLEECEVGSLFDSSKTNLEIYRELVEWEAEEFEEKLMACQNKVAENVAEQLIRVTIQSEPMLVNFYGEGLEEFTQSILDTHYPNCMNQLGTEGSPQLCENYIFVTTVFDFFDDLLNREVANQVNAMLGEGAHQDIVAPILENARAAFAQCRVDIAQSTLSDPSQRRPHWEGVITECLNRAMIVVSQEIVQNVIPQELASNPFLQKYNVSLGNNQVQEFALTFGSCMGSGLSEVQALVDYQDAIERWQGTCQLSLYKEVLVVVINQILESEFLGAGLSLEEISQLMEEYQQDPESLYSRIDRVASMEALDELTAQADQIVLQDLAPVLIDRMVENEAGDYLGSRTQQRIVNLVTEHFLRCTQSETIAVCQQNVMPLAIEAILYNVLPSEIEKEFEQASIHYITPAVIDRLDVRGVVRASFDTTTGRMLIDYLVQQITAGRGITEITQNSGHPNTFRQLVFQIFANNQAFMSSMLEAIVQPQMNQDRQRREQLSPFHWLALNVFVHQEIFVWRNIRNTPSGREVQRRFVLIFERLITQPNAPIQRQEMQELAQLVGQAAKEMNSHLNRN